MSLDLEKKGLSIFVSNPDEEHPDAFIMHLEAEIKRTNAKRLAIDGLSAFEYKYRKDMNIIIKRISSLVRKYQITTIVTIRFPVINGFQSTELSLSALFQNIILLKFVEVSGYMKRVMTILKISAAQQEMSLLEFKVSMESGGIEIIGPVGDT